MIGLKVCKMEPIYIHVVLNNMRENWKVKNIVDGKELISMNGTWPPMVIRIFIITGQFVENSSLKYILVGKHNDSICPLPFLN
jgi:hypothetical protein